MEDWMPSRKDIIADTVAGLVVLAVITVWQRFWPDTGPPLGTIAYAVVVVLGVMIIVQLERWSRRKRPATPKEIEATIRSWLDGAQYSVRRDPQGNALFQILAEIETPDKKRLPLSIGCLRESKQRVSIGIRIALSDDEQSALAKLDTSERDGLIYDLRLELLRLGVDYLGVATPLSEIAVQNHLDLNTLTELDFLKGCFLVRRAHQLIGNSIRSALSLPP